MKSTDNGTKSMVLLVSIAMIFVFTVAFSAFAVEEPAKEKEKAAETTGQPGEVKPAETETTATDSDAAAIKEDEESESEAIGFKENKVFLDFKEADIRDVLRVFARKAQINIVPSQKVQGTVTVKLTDVPWEKALQLILSQNNFILQKDEDGIYKVFTLDEVGAVPLETRVY